MKKIIIYSVISLMTISLSNAQEWVSTTPQNKKVVLEEFTGLKCTYCPDGHKRANELKAANKGNVFLVNIHSGGYATPGTGEPDMRTPEGDIIDDASGLTGYPAGSVNRFKNPRAESRANWSASANTILGQSSPVNAYVKAFFDRQTRELTTEVELYYTANGSANNKLTVMLTQDNILGPQTGGTQFYPENFIGNDYVHNHVLRDVITPGGAWGETISETSQGNYTYKKYVTLLPESIKNIPLLFYNLNVVAFVSESDNNNILTGYEAKVDFDQTGAMDLSLTDKTSASSGLCVDPFKPVVEVSNPSTLTVNSFELTATINGVKTTKTFNGTLAPGGKASIEFDQLITPRGDYSVTVNGFNNINGGDFFDTDQTNDAIQISGIGFQKKSFNYNKFGLNGNGDLDLGRWVKTNPNYIYRNNVGKVGGSMLYYLHQSWNIEGRPGDIVVGEADFTSITDPLVSYYYAYTDGGQGGSAPSIDVKVSEDCGVSFQSVKLTECQSTGEPGDPSLLWAATPNDFRQVSVDLSAYAGKSVLISVAGIPGSSGNSLYIDEIEVGSASKIASVDDIEVQGLSVYPNPANNSLNVSIERKENAKATLISLQGNVISEFDIINGSATLNTSSISEGLYIINVKSGESTSAIKVNIKH
jgi:hypothetical protein